MNRYPNLIFKKDKLKQIRTILEKRLSNYEEDPTKLVTAACLSFTFEEYLTIADCKELDNLFRILTEEEKAVLEVFMEQKEKREVNTIYLINIIDDYISQRKNLSSILSLLHEVGTFEIALSKWESFRDNRKKRLIDELSMYPHLITNRKSDAISNMLKPGIPRYERMEIITRLLKARSGASNLISVGEEIDIFISKDTDQFMKLPRILERSLKGKNSFIRWSIDHAASDTSPLSKSTVRQIRDCEIYFLVLSDNISKVLIDEYETAHDLEKSIKIFAQHRKRTSGLNDFLKKVEKIDVIKPRFFFTNFDLIRQLRTATWGEIKKHHDNFWLAIEAGYLENPDIDHLIKIYTSEIIAYHSLFKEKKYEPRSKEYWQWNYELDLPARWKYTDLCDVLQDKQGIILKGKFKGEKISFLRNLALHRAANIQWGSDKPIPLYIDFDDYSPDIPIFNYLCNRLIRSTWRPTRSQLFPVKGHRLLAKHLEPLFEKGQLLLLLDNLSKINRLESSQQTEAWKKINKFIGKSLKNRCQIALKATEDIYKNIESEIGLTDVIFNKADDESIIKAQRRHVNVSFVNNEYTPLSKTSSLAADSKYFIQLNIGVLSPFSIIENAEKHPFPVEHLPETKSGHWLEILVVSEDFSIRCSNYDLFLPEVGSSWGCDCQRGSEHTCKKQKRESHLFIPVESPGSPMNAQLRICIYYEKNLVQSISLTAKVLKSEQEGEGCSAWIDYSLSSRMSNVSSLPSRTLNIFTNHNTDGSHQIIIKGSSDNPIAFRLTEGQMAEAIKAVREVLDKIHREKIGDSNNSEPEYKNLYDKNNFKQKDKFVKDLKVLALHGSILLHALFEHDIGRIKQIKEELSEPSTVQISRASSSKLVFPWAFIYDIPISSDITKYEICRLLADWENLENQLKASPSSCPFEATHKYNTVCPFGFWGYKHMIEQPPSLPRGKDLALEIIATNHPPKLLAGLSTRLNIRLKKNHLKTINERLPNFNVLEKETREELFLELSKPELEFLYFYCHGVRKKLPKSELTLPALEIGKGSYITPQDVTGQQWTDDHWRHTSPLVFINACHSAELTPEMLINFIDAFAGAYAAGVIGTEISLNQLVINEAAEEFLDIFNRNSSVGEALKHMRLNFLKKGNLLGLAYTSYCSSNLKITQ